MSRVRRNHRLAAIVTALAAVLPAQTPITAADVQAVLQHLDQALAGGDADACLALFRPDNPELQEAHGAHLRRALATGLVRRSRLVGEPRREGERAIALVCAELHRRDEPERVLARDHALLVLQAIDGQVRPTLAVEVDATALGHIHDDRFACPPCNYRIGARGWLPVPLPPARAGSMEAVSFYLLGTDLACDVSVHLDVVPLEAARAAADLAGHLARLLPAAQVGAVEPWLPPSLGDRAPDDLRGARVQVRLPHDQRCLIHVDTLGPLRHVLLLRGSAAQIARHETAVRELLHSYTMLDLDVRAATVAARPLLAHTGGVLLGADYQNRRHRLACTGPEGWNAVRQAGGYLFQVTWTCPERQGRFTLTGHAPPPSLLHWDRARADAWLRELLAGEPMPPTAAWQAPADPTGFWRRGLTVPGRDGAPERRLELALRPELLVILDGVGRDEPTAALLRAAFASLRCL